MFKPYIQNLSTNLPRDLNSNFSFEIKRALGSILCLGPFSPFPLRSRGPYECGCANQGGNLRHVFVLLYTLYSAQTRDESWAYCTGISHRSMPHDGVRCKLGAVRYSLGNLVWVRRVSFLLSILRKVGLEGEFGRCWGLVLKCYELRTRQHTKC